MKLSRTRGDSSPPLPEEDDDDNCVERVVERCVENNTSNNKPTERRNTRHTKSPIRTFFAIFAIALFGRTPPYICCMHPETPNKAPALPNLPELLTSHGHRQFPSGGAIERIGTSPIFVARGFGLANVVIVNGTSGVVLIDTTESSATMSQILEKLWLEVLGQRREIEAIVYSHFHSDHVFGAAAAVDQKTKIWAHATTRREIDKVFSLTAGATQSRAMKQFGTLLNKENGFINAGIGPQLNYHPHCMEGLVYPTHVWSGDSVVLTLGGEEMTLLFYPGESRDQVCVHLPHHQILFAADNFYSAFPNVYAIRGTESRDPRLWALNLEKLRALRPVHLVLGHTQPLVGREVIWDALTAYRDALLYVHDQTVRYLNKGLSLDNIVTIVVRQFPNHLATNPHLQQYYGTIAWAVRATYTHYLGWFSGQPEHLHTLPTDTRALYMASLAGGPWSLVDGADRALSQGHSQWALELANHACNLFVPRSAPCPSPSLCQMDFVPNRPAPAFPDSKVPISFARRALRAKISALERLADSTSAASGRNWYLTAAIETREWLDNFEKDHRSNSGTGSIFGAAAWRSLLSSLLGSRWLFKSQPSLSQKFKVTPEQRKAALSQLTNPISVFDFMPSRLKSVESTSLLTKMIGDGSSDPMLVVRFTFWDTNQSRCIVFRRGVSFSREECAEWLDPLDARRPVDILDIATSSDTLIAILKRDLSPIVAVLRGQLVAEVAGSPTTAGDGSWRRRMGVLHANVKNLLHLRWAIGLIEMDDD